MKFISGDRPPLLFRRCPGAIVFAGLVLVVAVPDQRIPEADPLPDSWTISLPPGNPEAPCGSELAVRWDGLSLEDREQQLGSEILAGNIPDGWRRFVPIRVSKVIDGRMNELVMFVSPDYAMVGSDDDALRMPMSPSAAQHVADRLDCLLPTRRMVDQIYSAATIVLEPQPLPPTPEMNHVSYFALHHQAIQQQLADRFPQHNSGQLTAGHKKDVVLTSDPAAAIGKVAIYGWHRAKNRPIQPLYLGHAETWVDYSHGIRLVARRGFLNGAPCDLKDVLTDDRLSLLLSDEGPLRAVAYRTKEAAAEQTRSEGGEQATILQWSPGVRVCINEPVRQPDTVSKSVELLFFALPNGNTIEQTLGKRIQPGDDWHFDIQHIAAQARFLRSEQPEKRLVLILLEAEGLSWPAWRKSNGDDLIPKLISEMRARYSVNDVSMVLSGHSGGGSLIFGYLNATTEIPSDVVRIALLDATYAYETKRHYDKLATWLKRPRTSLCVLAYKDDQVVLNGKPIVSATGGTWYRSRLMRDDLRQSFELPEVTDGEILKSRSEDGRIQFLLHANSDNRILHTVQVEKNGLIHCLLSGTRLEEVSYRYFGDRAYSEFIR